MLRNVFNCECGGLRHICAKHGHLPDSLEHYKDRREAKPELHVVWAGRGELLDSRAERPDPRLSTMPTYDLDDGESDAARPARPYNLTGKYAGKFSRTNPDAPHYKPTVKAPTTDPSEVPNNGSEDSGTA